MRSGSQHRAFTDKKATASFETIAAIFGTILIGTGIAWLIAQNWHQIPSALKITLLLGATAGAYAAGVILRVRNYPKVSKALLILGAILYTLSIFLIAQIFFTGGSPQGIAWLWMLSFAGVLVASHLLESREILGVGILESMIWVSTQAFAFLENFRGLDWTQLSLVAPFFLTGIALGVVAAGIYIRQKIGRSLGITGALALAILASFSMGIFGAIFAVVLLPIALSIRRSDNTEEALNLCKGLLSSTLIFWIALLLIRPGTLQESTLLVFLAAAVAFALAYYLKSSSTLFLALTELTGGVVLQYLSFTREGPVALGMLAVYLLELGAVFYGLSLLHRAKGHGFSRSYVWWTALYFLAFAYLISFQFSLPALWATETASKMPTVLSLFLGLAAFISLTLGTNESLKKGSTNKKEIIGVIAIVVLFAIAIGSASFVASPMGRCIIKDCATYQDQSSCQGAPQELGCLWKGGCTVKQCYEYNDQTSCNNAPKGTGCKWENWGGNGGCYSNNYNRLCNPYNNQQKNCLDTGTCNWMPEIFGNAEPASIQLWGLWLFTNIVFLAAILGAVFYGTWQGLPGMVNLGIGAFALDIVTRYAGLLMDYWGSLGLGVIFISGGIVLIGGGLLVERWRKRLISRTKSNTSA